MDGFNFSANFQHDRDELKFKTQGLPARNARTVKKFKSGDRVVYYIVKKKKFGATATITGSYYHDTIRIWTDKDELWPSRAPSKPNLVLDDDQLVDANELISEFSWVKENSHWGVFFQGSLRQIPKTENKGSSLRLTFISVFVNMRLCHGR